MLGLTFGEYFAPDEIAGNRFIRNCKLCRGTALQPRPMQVREAAQIETISICDTVNPFFEF
jgi:hypothetical protein